MFGVHLVLVTQTACEGRNGRAKALTGINQELVRYPRVVHVMDGCCKDGCQNLQVCENRLGKRRKEYGKTISGLKSKCWSHDIPGVWLQLLYIPMRENVHTRMKSRQNVVHYFGISFRLPRHVYKQFTTRRFYRNNRSCLTSRAGVDRRMCVDCATSAACRLLW